MPTRTARQRRAPWGMPHPPRTRLVERVVTRSQATTSPKGRRRRRDGDGQCICGRWWDSDRQGRRDGRGWRCGRHARGRRRRECNLERRDRKRRIGSSAIDRCRIERRGPIDRKNRSCRRQRSGVGCGANRRRHGDDQCNRAGRRRAGLRQFRPDGLCLLNRVAGQGLCDVPDWRREPCRERPARAA